MYHFFPAQSWAQDGTLTLDQGTYDRTSLYTVLIGVLFWLFGDSLVVGRMPSLVSTAAWVMLIYVTLRVLVDRQAGLIGAILFALSGGATEVAQLIRFYGVHGFTFFAGTMALFVALHRPERPLKQVAVFLGLAAVFYVIAAYLQLTTLIGLVGVGLWAVGLLFFRWLLEGTRQGYVRAGGLVALGVLALLVAAVVFPGQIASLYAEFRWASAWADDVRDDATFYHQFLLVDFPVLWALLPVGIVLALKRQAALTLLCASVFVLGVGLLSFGGMKTGRYIVYLVPFFLMIWAIALSPVLSAMVAWFDAACRSAAASLVGKSTAPRFVTLAGRLILIGSLGFIAISHTTVVKAIDNLIAPLHRPIIAGWSEAQPHLEPWIARDDVYLVTTDELHTLYAFGRYDLLINVPRLSEVPPQTEFVVDWRTGKPIISQADSLERIMDCHSEGLIVAESWAWNEPHLLNRSITELIEQRAETISVPPETRIIAFAWTNENVADNDACDLY